MYTVQIPVSCMSQQCILGYCVMGRRVIQNNITSGSDGLFLFLFLFIVGDHM